MHPKLSPPSNRFSSIVARDGRTVPFAAERIVSAVSLAMTASGEGDPAKDSNRVAAAVIAELNQRYLGTHTLRIEEIQDLVEEQLILLDFPKTAKAYILYRHQRIEIREKTKIVPEKVRRLVAESKQYFPNALAEFVYYRTYSRWIEEEGRRETWIETVDRYMGFMHEIVADRLTDSEYLEIQTAILEMRVMPSMRLLWSAGKAARASNVAAYNCSYIAPERIEDLAEIMYVLMCGAGVGFSVENEHVQRFPIVERQSSVKLPVHAIADSREGWCDALKLGLTTWYSGKDIDFDFSLLRPAGARLHTMSGWSSGPEPLRMLFSFARSKILERQSRRLRPIDIHDIICKIGETVCMGGVRRSALISLSDLDDDEMRAAKSGHFYINHPERALANNSTVYTEKPSAVSFLEEWLALAKSGSGERGIFNRSNLPDQVPARRRAIVTRAGTAIGVNPCGEIVLRSRQFCNLSEVVARPDDTEAALLDKIRIAAILGTYQSMLTDFPYLSEEWRKNCEEERLLGVSISGQWDCPACRNPSTLRKLRECAVATNRRYAAHFGINAATAVTCVKPSGTVSQLADASSGMHTRFAPYYIRRIRISGSDPLFTMLKEQKFPYAPDVSGPDDRASTFVLAFPVRAPENAVTRNMLDAIEQLEYWKMVKREYTEHNPSVTIFIGANEWIATADWLYKNWEAIGGLSFLPREENVYKLAPYEEITKEKYDELAGKLPAIDFSRIVVYEKDDRTTGGKALECSGPTCEFDPEEAPVVP